MVLYVIGLVTFLTGFLLRGLSTKKANYLLGYRTKLAMKNQDTWNEAHKYSANTFIVLGFVFVPLQFVLSELNISYGYDKIVLLVCFVIMIILNKVHLKKVFNNDGSRKLLYK